MALEHAKLREFAGRPLSTLEWAKPTVVSSTDPLSTVISTIRERGDSCALVAEGEQLRGIVTERDILDRCLEESVDWSQPVTAVMTAEPASLGPSDPIGSVIRLMRARDFRTVPVVEDGTIRAVVRLADLIRHIAELFPEEILNLPPRADQAIPRQEGA